MGPIPPPPHPGPGAPFVRRLGPRRRMANSRLSPPMGWSDAAGGPLRWARKINGSRRPGSWGRWARLVMGGMGNAAGSGPRHPFAHRCRSWGLRPGFAGSACSCGPSCFGGPPRHPHEAAPASRGSTGAAKGERGVAVQALRRSSIGHQGSPLPRYHRLGGPRQPSLPTGSAATAWSAAGGLGRGGGASAGAAAGPPRPGPNLEDEIRAGESPRTKAVAARSSSTAKSQIRSPTMAGR